MDLSPEIKQFAAEHEKEIKTAVLKMMADYFDSSLSENYHEKWDAGVAVHGPFTEEKLPENWNEQLSAEFKDAFWYTTVILFRQSREQAPE